MNTSYSFPKCTILYKHVLINRYDIIKNNKTVIYLTPDDVLFRERKVYLTWFDKLLGITIEKKTLKTLEKMYDEIDSYILKCYTNQFGD